jgi:hypothetical protein
MARKNRPRIHNEWMRAVQRGNRKSCTECHEKLDPGESIWSWGEYHNVRFRNIRDVCKKCWPQLTKLLVDHERQCPENCTIQIICMGSSRPWWMVLPREACLIKWKRAFLFDVHPFRLGETQAIVPTGLPNLIDVR